MKITIQMVGYHEQSCSCGKGFSEPGDTYQYTYERPYPHVCMKILDELMKLLDKHDKVEVSLL